MTEINKRGNEVIRHFVLEGSRYRYDFSEKLKKDGFEQYDTDQDAWYFGVWTSKKLLQILSYVEGDLILVKCPDAEHYNREIQSMNEFYGAGYICKIIDPVKKQMTTLIQDRELFFIK